MCKVNVSRWTRKSDACLVLSLTPFLFFFLLTRHIANATRECRRKRNSNSRVKKKSIKFTFIFISSRRKENKKEKYLAKLKTWKLVHCIFLYSICLVLLIALTHRKYFETKSIHFYFFSFCVLFADTRHTIQRKSIAFNYELSKQMTNWPIIFITEIFIVSVFFAWIL